MFGLCASELTVVEVELSVTGARTCFYLSAHGQTLIVRGNEAPGLTYGVSTLRWKHPRMRSFSQKTIHSSEAPVVLLTGIAGLLGGMVSGLARIIDRACEVGRGSLSLSKRSRNRFACRMPLFAS